ncbi:hypothetical protein, partial [Aphanothece microscopica]
MWETGFGYLELSKDGRIEAPDIVPPKNNPTKVNLSKDWRIWELSEHKTPLIHDYDLIFIVASPCKLFAPIYYPRPFPTLLSAEVLHSIIFSCFIDHARFDGISPWMFRISAIIRSLVTACGDKIVFIGAPLPILGKEDMFIEPLRNVLASDHALRELHAENIANIRLICDESLRSGVSPFRIILPPSDLCCDLTLS